MYGLRHALIADAGITEVFVVGERPSERRTFSQVAYNGEMLPSQ